MNAACVDVASEVEALARVRARVVHLYVADHEVAVLVAFLVGREGSCRSVCDHQVLKGGIRARPCIQDMSYSWFCSVNLAGLRNDRRPHK